jgi:hypothetical protein
LTTALCQDGTVNPLFALFGRNSSGLAGTRQMKRLPLIPSIPINGFFTLTPFRPKFRLSQHSLTRPGQIAALGAPLTTI